MSKPSIGHIIESAVKEMRLTAAKIAQDYPVAAQCLRREAALLEQTIK